MKKIALFLISLYQAIPLRSHFSCVFIPRCSDYTKDSIEKYGFLKGSYLGIKRIFRCHPVQKNKFDPIP